MEDDGRTRIWVPRSIRKELILGMHFFMSHSRAPTLVPLLKERYIWRTRDTDRMRQDVEELLDECHFCQVVRARRTLNHGHYSSRVWTGPGQALGLDHYYVGIKNPEGFNWILTLLDLFTKFTLYIPTRSTTAEETIEVILRHFVSTLGWPEIIFSDYHASFRGTLSQLYCRATGTQWLHTAPYAHEQAGAMEERHKILRVCFMALKDKSTWPQNAIHAQMARNYTLHAGISPHEAMFGRKPRTVFDIDIEDHVDAKSRETQDGTISYPIAEQVMHLREAQRVIKSYVTEAKRVSSAKSLAQIN